MLRAGNCKKRKGGIVVKRFLIEEFKKPIEKEKEEED